MPKNNDIRKRKSDTGPLKNKEGSQLANCNSANLKSISGRFCVSSMANQKTYSRRKKGIVEKKSEDTHQIDLIPKCVQQPRTRSPGGPKRRTDFSLFFCSQLSPPCSSDVSPESHSSKDGLIVAKHVVSQGRTKEISSVQLILCCQSQDEGERFSPESSELQSKETESSSDAYEQKDEIEITMESTPEKLHHSGSKGIYQTSAGGERLTCSDSDNASINGHVSLQCSGTDESAMRESVKSRSRSQNGLLERGDINPSKRLPKHSAEPNYLNENDQPSGILSGGRGKRKRKPKVHFDELKSPEESVKVVRRLKIMRYLGLAAPVGSPFTQPRQC